MINAQYINKILKNELETIIPNKQMNFVKIVNGNTPDDWNSTCNFDCFYYCYKMKLPTDIIWLNSNTNTLLSIIIVYRNEHIFI